MKRLPSRFRRLDGALADLPVEQPMLLTELDGFLTGVLVAPANIAPDEWMAAIWGPDTDGIPPFEDPLDVQWFAAAVTARRDEIARDLARGRLQPILGVDERDGEVLWEDWIAGFDEAIALCPEAWAAMAAARDVSGAWRRLRRLVDVAHEESTLDSVAVNALQDEAVAELTDVVQQLYVAFGGGGDAAADAPGATRAAKIGRNDPCACGSGRKHKRCCG